MVSAQLDADWPKHDSPFSMSEKVSTRSLALAALPRLAVLPPLTLCSLEAELLLPLPFWDARRSRSQLALDRAAAGEPEEAVVMLKGLVLPLTEEMM